MRQLKRFFCFMWHGHDLAHHYTRDYSGQEVLVATCRRCGHTHRVSTGR